MNDKPERCWWRFAGWSAVALLVIAGARDADAQQPATKQQKTTAGLAPFRADDKLPLLRTQIIEPVRDREAFKIFEGRAVSFPREPDANGGNSLPDVTAKDAEEKFRDWIRTYYGELPDGTNLVRDEEHPPGSLWLSQTYRGIPVDGRAVLRRNADGKLSAYFELRSCHEVEGTAQAIIESKQAITTWRRILASPKVSDEERAHFEKYAQPELVYVWSPPRFVNLIGTEELESVLGRRAPTWCVDGGIRMVDCHTGKPWVND